MRYISSRMFYFSDHRGRLPLGAIVAISAHTFIIYSTENLSFQHVIQACSSSWLQEHVTDISEGYVMSVCVIYWRFFHFCQNPHILQLKLQKKIKIYSYKPEHFFTTASFLAVLWLHWQPFSNFSDKLDEVQP